MRADMIGDKKEYGRYILTRGSSFYEGEFADPTPGDERELFGCTIPNCWTSLKLIQKTAYNDDTSIFTFELPRSDRRLGLRPGAYLLVRCPGVEHGGGDAIRPYTSISEDSRRGSFDVLIKRYDESGEHPDIAARRKNNGGYYLPANNYKPPGAASNYIHSLKVGEYLRFKHSEVCKSKISLDLLGLKEEELFNEPNAHIVGPRSRANSKASAVSGSGANSPRPSNSEAKGLDSSFSGISPSLTRSGGFGGSESTPEPGSNPSTAATRDPEPVVDSVFAKMMMYGTNPTALFNSMYSADMENVLAKEPFVAPLKDDDLFRASLRHAENMKTGSSTNVAVTDENESNYGSSTGVICVTDDEHAVTQGMRKAEGCREDSGVSEAAHCGRSNGHKESGKIVPKVESTPAPATTPESDKESGLNISKKNPYNGVHDAHEETKEGPASFDVCAEGDSKQKEDYIKQSSLSSSGISSEKNSSTFDGSDLTCPSTPTAPSVPPPGGSSSGRPRPPVSSRSSFGNSPRPGFGRRRQGSFEASNDLGTATPSTASSPSDSRAHTPNGGRIRTPPRVVEGKEDEPSPEPPTPPVSHDESHKHFCGSPADACVSKCNSRRNSRGVRGALSRAQSLNWGDGPDAKVESLTLVAVGVGVSPMIRILRAALELSTKLNVVFFLGVREVKDILMREMLEQLANTHTYRFKLVYCVGSRYNNIHMGANSKNKDDYRPPPVPEGYEDLDRYEENIFKKLGWIDHQVINEHAPPPSDTHRVVVCGLPGVYDKLCGSRFEDGVLPENSVLARLGFSAHQVIKM